MEGSCSEGKEMELHSEKKLKTCEVNKDFISDLPDPIIVHILSFLPLKDAVKTVLLRRFGTLWLNMPVLDLDNCVDHEYEGNQICEYEDFLGIIHQVWNHHCNAALDKLRLRSSFLLNIPKDEPAPDLDYEFYAAWAKEKNAVYQLKKLISYAISREVKVLDLDFMGCDVLMSVSQFYRLPDVFRSSHLTDLRLEFCEIMSCEKLNLQALKVLFLHQVSLSDEVMKKILLGCPFLEDLSISDCYGLRNLNCENANLKKLMIDLTDREDSHFFISCPHVASLKISGWIECANLLDVSPLVDVSIDFSNLFRCERRQYATVRNLVLKVSQCKTFSPCCWSILVMTIWKLLNVPCPQFMCKAITINLGMTKWHLPGLYVLLKGSLMLETLTMCISRGVGEGFFRWEKSQWIWEYDFEGDNFWDSQVATFPYLETITIHFRKYEPYAIQMVKFLLKNAPKLQKVVISTNRTEGHDLFSSDQRLELSQKLLNFPRASSQAVIFFS